MGNIKINIKKNKGLITIVLLVVSLLIPSILMPSNTEAVKKSNTSEVLSETDSIKATPILTITPTPVIPSSTTTSLFIATVTPSPLPTYTPTMTPVPATTTTTVQAQPTNTPTLTLTLTPTITPTETPPTPTPQGMQVQVGIDYAGERASDIYATTVGQGQSAWDAVVSAVGVDNLKYTDYGGDMGIFITGFNGIDAASNQYFEFRINDVSSNVGVSSYKCNNGDKLSFVLMSF
jgi:hypothetical protein